MATNINGVNARLEKMEHKFDSALSNMNDKIIQVQTSLANDIEEVKHETSNEIAKLHGRVDALYNQNNSGKTTELIINGIPCLVNENLEELVSKINAVINNNEEPSIISIHRFKSPKHQSAVQDDSVNKIILIVIKFANNTCCRSFHTNYFAFNKKDPLKLSHVNIESRNRIYINENLSKQSLSLLKKAKNLKKNGKIASAYSFNGQVCVYHQKDDRKFVIISSVDDLKKFD